MTVKRYHIVGTCGGNCHDIEEAIEGEYVSFDDYSKLEGQYNILFTEATEEIKRLQDELNGWMIAE